MNYEKLKLKIFFIAILFLGLFGMAGMSEAADYYVSPMGDDSNPGTLSQPWRHIKYALCDDSYFCPDVATNQNVLQAGDVLNIRAGTYDEHDIRVSHSGVSGAYITIQGYMGDAMPILDANAAPGSNTSVFILENTDYIKIRGLHLRGGGGSESGTITLGRDFNVSNVIIENNIISDTNVGGTRSSYNPAHIRISQGGVVTNVTVQNNEIFGADASGFKIDSRPDHASALLIQNNEIHDVLMGIAVKWGNSINQGITLRYNMIYDCSERGIWADQGYITILHNVISGCAVGMLFGENWGGNDCTVRHNTLYGNTKSVYFGNYASANNLADNIRYSSSSIEDYGNGNTLSDFVSDPLFVDAQNNNFQLANGSGAHNTASDGTDYGANISLVGIQDGDSSDSTTPSPPSGLRIR